MSKINIDRIVRDIKIRSTVLTPIIEAVCNSIDAIGDNRTDGAINIVVKRDGQTSFDMEGSQSKGDIIAVDIIDNGEGFNSINRDSFDTFRSGLKMNKGGKGFGRFMYLKYFNRVTIESVYRCDEGFRKRTFVFGHSNEIIEQETDKLIEGEDITTGTTLHLSSIKSREFDKGIDVIARKLVERLLVFFATGGNHTPTIKIMEEDGSENIVLNQYVESNSGICQIGETKSINIQGKTQSFSFSVKVYKIFFSAITNKICLTANMREVTENSLHTYVPEFKETMFEITKDGQQKNYTVKVYVQGEYLDDNVTTERDGFYFGKEEDLLSELSERAIYKEAAAIAKEYFSLAIKERFEEKKKKVEHYVFSSAPWNKTMLNDVDMESIPVGITDFDLEMLFQKRKFEKEQQARIAINKLISKSDEQQEEKTDDMEEEIKSILALVTEGQKNDLAHYVCQRKRVIDLYDELRKRMDNGKAHKESELHNLFFPMIKNDREVDYESNNLWLLDERFNFTQYIASDKVISKEDHKEPDIALFYEEMMFYRNGDNVITSPIAIVEFKRPKRKNYPDAENPITQALRYAKKILDGKYEMPEGLEKIDVDKTRTPVYIYIVCDIEERIIEFANLYQLSISPDGEGYFGYNNSYNAYIEIKSFKKVVSDAKMRNQIFFKKLGLI